MNTYETDRDLTDTVAAMVAFDRDTATLTATLYDGAVLSADAVRDLMGADAFAAFLAQVAEDAAEDAADMARERAAGASDYV